jgi:hypothetical protein
LVQTKKKARKDGGGKGKGKDAEQEAPGQTAGAKRKDGAPAADAADDEEAGGEAGPGLGRRCAAAGRVIHSRGSSAQLTRSNPPAALLAPPLHPLPIPHRAGEDGAGEDGAAPGNERLLGASKKDPALRRRELLGSGPKSLAAALTALVAARAPALLRSPAGGDLVVEVARGGEDGARGGLAGGAGRGALQGRARGRVCREGSCGGWWAVA